MPHISKRKLDKEQLKKLNKELVRSFERAFKDLRSGSVFYEFFTYTEQVMFAKRLAAIAMLSRGVSVHAIAESLKMSPSTINRMSAKFENGKYTRIVKHALGKKDIWEIIEDVLTIGGVMPPRAGYYRWHLKRKWNYKEKLENT